MMHGDRSRDPPPYHPGWGGLARKLVLEENNPTRVATDSYQLPSSAHDLEAMGMEHRESFAPGWGTVSSEQR